MGPIWFHASHIRGRTIRKMSHLPSWCLVGAVEVAVIIKHWPPFPLYLKAQQKRWFLQKKRWIFLWRWETIVTVRLTANWNSKPKAWRKKRWVFFEMTKMIFLCVFWNFFESFRAEDFNGNNGCLNGVHNDVRKLKKICVFWYPDFRRYSTYLTIRSKYRASYEASFIYLELTEIVILFF